MGERMIKTLKPYAYVEFNLMLGEKAFILIKRNKYLMFDGEYVYEIDQETYWYLESKGVKVWKTSNN